MTIGYNEDITMISFVPPVLPKTWKRKQRKGGREEDKLEPITLDVLEQTERDVRAESSNAKLDFDNLSHLAGNPNLSSK